MGKQTISECKQMVKEKQKFNNADFHKKALTEDKL